MLIETLGQQMNLDRIMFLEMTHGPDTQVNHVDLQSQYLSANSFYANHCSS